MFDLFPAFTKITREGLNNIPRAVLSMIRPGPGISIFPTGDGGICISTQQRQGMQQGGLTGGGGGGNDRLAKFVSLNEDGDTMEVYLWSGTDWDVATTTVYKPYKFQKSLFADGLTHTFADGESCTFNVTSLNARYQRRRLWETFSEVQEITEAYEIDEKLQIIINGEGNYMDSNNAGRHWAAILEVE